MAKTKYPKPVVGRTYEWAHQPVTVTKVRWEEDNGSWAIQVETIFGEYHETNSEHLGDWPRK